MPDSRTSYDAPRGWDDAFAVLPLEAPPADTWSSIARRLPSRPPVSRRRHRSYWFAAAAAMAMAAVIPALRWSGSETPAVSSSAAIAPAPSTSSPSSISAPSSIAPDAAPAASVAVIDQVPSKALPSAMESLPSSIPTTAAATAAPRIATRTRSRRASPNQPTSRPSDRATAETAAAEQDSRLENLYAESARLEAILAQLQESRAASAAATALSAELQDRIADIDGALSQPDMPSTAQSELWQQRVDALRQLTGVETTQRWMAAQGTATEGPLAQVY